MDVFISYARAAARPEALSLRAELTAAGLDVFLDEEGIPYGDDFPARIATALAEARVAVVFLDELYVTRPWCVLELQLLNAAYRATSALDGTETDHVVVAMPEAGAAPELLAHLPPPVATRSWPGAGQTTELAVIVRETLANIDVTIGQRLEQVADGAAAQLRAGGRIPLPWPPEDDAAPGPPAQRVVFQPSMPASMQREFIGREAELWRTFDGLVGRRAFGSPTSVAVQGPGGSGKSQLAAEFVSRYGGHFGGVVWLLADGGKAGLADQYASLLAALDPDAGVADGGDDDATIAANAEAIRSHLRTNRFDRPLLWVIDGLPEPGGGGPPPPVARWCPAPSEVALLVTSRRTQIEGIATTVDLAALPQATSVDLLTQPPVERSWLTDGEWDELARWVGGLPLALSILRQSLVNGFVTGEALARVRDEEPAVLLDRQVEVLRTEVAEPYLQGVGDAFAFSYERLGDLAGVQDGARLFARLAGYPLPEDLADALVSSEVIGRLAKRSWLQPAGRSADGRRWSMHAIPSSFLRATSPDADDDYRRLFEWLDEVLQEGESERWGRAVDVNLDVITRDYSAAIEERGPSSDATTAAAVTLAVRAGLFRLGSRDGAGIRYLGAGLAETSGASTALVAQLGTPAVLDDEAMAAGVPAVLQGMPSDVDAADLLVSLLGDRRDDVRYQAMIHAPRLPWDHVADALVEAVLSEVRPQVQKNAATGCDAFFHPSNPGLGRLTDRLLDRVGHGDPTERRGATELLTRLLLVNGPALEIGQHRAPSIVGSLLELALDEDDESVAIELARAAGAVFVPEAIDELHAAYERAAAPATERVAIVLSTYLLSASKPGILDAEVVTGRDGSVRFNIDIPKHVSLPASAYQLMAQLVLTGNDRERAAGVDALVGVEHIALLAEPILALAEAGEPDRALSIIDALLDAGRGHPNALFNVRWWQAHVFETLERWRDAAAAIGIALDAVPDDQAPVFARERRIENLSRIGSEAASETAVVEAAGILDDHPDSRRAVEVSAQCLYDLERFDEAEHAASLLLVHDDDASWLWFLRSLARGAQGKLDEALDDVTRALLLDPAIEGAAAYRDELQAGLDRDR